MAYAEFYDEVTAALKVTDRQAARGGYSDNIELVTTLALAAIKRKDDELEALRIIAGIRKAHSHQEAAQMGLACLLAARRYFREAKSRQTLARLRHTLASAYGAVRAGGYRDHRAAEAQQQTPTTHTEETTAP